MIISETLKNNDHLPDFVSARSSVAIVLIDEQQRIADCNNGFLKLFSLLNKPVGAPLADFLLSGAEGIVFTPGNQEVTCNPKTGVHGVLMVYRLPCNGGLLLWCERLLSTNHQVVEQMSRLNNEFICLQRELAKKNHHLKRIQHELKEKIVQLEEALSQVKRLEGTIPICMYCKSIRNDEESWQQMERYIMDHSDAEFSHGICPTCMEKHFGTKMKR
ncbi:MAG: hypothetical protein J0665_20930 [Deltaproteobacteria bacterium]|nr:hypothetical protein [Deltaproteobacteria bacterium]